MYLCPLKYPLAVFGLILSLAACSTQDDGSGSADVEEMATAKAADRVAAPISAASSSDASSLPTPPAITDPAILTLKGLGPLRIGMAISENSGWRADETQISDQCRTYASNGERHAYAMGDGKVVKRITVNAGSEVKTEKGIGIGASEEQVRRAYPGVRAEPHKYVDPPAKYLTWIPQAGGPGLRFELGADGKVALIHAGVMPWLEYVEGCA